MLVYVFNGTVQALLDGMVLVASESFAGYQVRLCTYNSH